MREQDVDFRRNQIIVRDGKGFKDRVTLLPESLKGSLEGHLQRVKLLHERDLAEGGGDVHLPFALARKYPNAVREWGWQYVFPATSLSIDPRSGARRRHHVNELGLQRAMKEAVRLASLVKPATCHALHHSFATHLLESGYDHPDVAGIVGAQGCGDHADLHACHAEAGLGRAQSVGWVKRRWLIPKPGKHPTRNIQLGKAESGKQPNRRASRGKNRSLLWKIGVHWRLVFFGGQGLLESGLLILSGLIQRDASIPGSLNQSIDRNMKARLSLWAISSATILFGIPLVSQQVPSANCFDPRFAISQKYEAYTRAADRYALLKWKTENGLFDLRLCDDPGALPFQTEMTAEREAILAEAQVQSAAVAFVAANNAVRLAVADTFGSVLRGMVTTLDETASSGAMDKAVGFLANQTDKYRGLYINLQTDNAGNVRQSRDSLLRVTDALNESTRTVAYLDQVAKEAQKINPAQLPSIARLWAKAEKSVESNAKLVAGVQRDHMKDLVVQADLRRAIAAHDRVENLLTNYDKLTKAISTVSGFAKSISEDDTAETAKTALETLESLNEWCVGRLDKDLASAKTIAEDGMKSYVLQKNWSISTKPLAAKTESKLLSTIVAARASEASAENGKQLLEHIQSAQKVLTKTLPYLIEARKFYKEAGEKGFWETAEKEAVKRVKVLESMRKTRDDLRGTIALPSMNAITYFQGMATAVRSMSKLAEVKVFAAILEGAADQLELAAAVPEAFARLTKLNPAQGGRFDGVEFQGLHDALKAHPALSKLKAFVPPDEGSMVIVPRAPGGLETKISKEQFDKVLMGLSVLTSVTGKNPTQQDLFDLASGSAVTGDRPLLGPAGMVADKFVYKLDELIDLSSRHLLEEQAGAVARELSFLNSSLDFSGEQFAYTDLSELAKRRRVSDLSVHKARLNEAFRVAYGNDLTPKVFGAVLAGTGAGPRTRENVSPLEQRILEARNRRMQSSPVKVAWIRAQQSGADRLEVSAGIETGILPENSKICVAASLRYPDGSSTELKWSSPGPGRDPLTTEFSLEAIDWEKMGNGGLVAIEVSAQAGTVRSVLQQPLKLDTPVVLEEAGAYPSSARKGTTVQLFALATLSELIGPSIQPDVTFQVHIPDGKKYLIPATDVSRWNNVAMTAEGNFVVPDDLKPGARLEVEAIVKLNRFETSARTWLGIVNDPDIKVGVVGAATDLKSVNHNTRTTVEFKSEALGALLKPGQFAVFRLYRSTLEKGPWEKPREDAGFYTGDKIGNDYNGKCRIGPDSAFIWDDWPAETNRVPYWYKIAQVIKEEGKEKELESELLPPSKPVIAFESYGITNNQVHVQDFDTYNLVLTLRQPDQAFVYPGAHFTLESDGKTLHAWSPRREGDLDIGNDSYRRASISLPTKIGPKQFTLQAKSASGVAAPPIVLNVIGHFRDEDERRSNAAQPIEEFSYSTKGLLQRSADGPAEVARSQAALPGIEERHKDFHGIDYFVEKSQALANIAYFQHRIQEEIEDSRTEALAAQAISLKFAGDHEKALALRVQHYQKLPSIAQRAIAWEEQVFAIGMSVRPDRSPKELAARKEQIMDRSRTAMRDALYPLLEEARLAADYSVYLPYAMAQIDAFKTNSAALAKMYEELANVTAKLSGNRQQAASYWLKAQDEASRSYSDPAAELKERVKRDRPAWWPEGNEEIKPVSLPTSQELDRLKSSVPVPKSAPPATTSTTATNDVGKSPPVSGVPAASLPNTAMRAAAVNEFNRGSALATKGDWSGAETAYRSAVEADRAHPESWNGLGNALYAQKKYSDAESAYRELVRLNPTNSAYRSYLALSLQSQNKLTEAESSFREAVQADGNQVSHLNGLGHVLLAQGKLGEAESAYREMIRLQPGNVVFQSYLGTTLQYERKWTEAETLYAAIIRADPNNADYQCQLGQVLAGQNKWQAAEQPYREAVRLDPNNSFAREGVGHVLMFYQRFQDAEAVYRQAIQINPQVGRFHGDLAAALLRQNRRAEALPPAREAMRLGERQHWVLKELGLAQ